MYVFSDESQALVDMSLSLRCTSKVLKVYPWVIGLLGQLRHEGATKKNRTQSCSSLLLTGVGVPARGRRAHMLGSGSLFPGGFPVLGCWSQAR